MANGRWTCSRCGEAHEGLPLSWAFDEPIHWLWLDEERRAEGFCDGDFCAMTDDAGNPARFVRGTIDIPILDAAPDDEDDRWFTIGVWSTLSERSFAELIALQERDEEVEAGPWGGWLANRIRVYPDTLDLQTQVLYRPGLRPRIELRPGEHPLTREARGISNARAQALAAEWHHLVGE